MLILCRQAKKTPGMDSCHCKEPLGMAMLATFLVVSDAAERAAGMAQLQGWKQAGDRELSVLPAGPGEGQL